MTTTTTVKYKDNLWFHGSECNITKDSLKDKDNVGDTIAIISLVIIRLVNQTRNSLSLAIKASIILIIFLRFAVINTIVIVVFFFNSIIVVVVVIATHIIITIIIKIHGRVE